MDAGARVHCRPHSWMWGRCPLAAAGSLLRIPAFLLAQHPSGVTGAAELGALF